MLQNKIYQNFSLEIFKTFLLILFGLSLIALTVRAVGFLELIVENGYPVDTYFKYSILNLFGISTKFIPLSFFIALSIFILKHANDSEFSILWTSGVKKIHIVNLFFFSSILIMCLHLLLSALFTPLALNKSRQLLSKEQFNSFLPTVRMQQFSDTFKGFTFIVEKKVGNEIKNIFLHDKNKTLKNLSSNSKNINSTTIIAETGLIDTKKMFLFDGEIITSKKNNEKNEIIKFEQLTVDLSDLTTTTIKEPKLQELSTIKLLNCFKTNIIKEKFCNENFKKEIIPNLNRRIILPFYIPIISLICSFLLIRSEKKIFNKLNVFAGCFIIILFTELAIRYTGINNYLLIFFIIFPFALSIIFYLYLIFKFSNEYKSA